MRENLLKNQPTWGLRRAQGTGQKSATPATLTKVILVLLTMFLIPSAAWGQWEPYTFVFTGGLSSDAGGWNLYAVDESAWQYVNTNSYTNHLSTAVVSGSNSGDNKGITINVQTDEGTSVLTPPSYYTIKKVTLNYSNLEVTEGSEIYVRAANSEKTSYYSDPCLMTSEGSLDINLSDEGIPSENLCFLIYSNDNKAYSYNLNSITITKIADYNLSIGDVHLTGSNVNPETGAVTGMTGISFTPANTENETPATLTLNNANFGPSYKGIVWSGNGTLKIQYSGNNIINTRNGNELNVGSDAGYCIIGNSSSGLILSASDDASTLTLKPSTGGTPESNNSRAAISGFTDVQIDKTNGWGMYYTDDYSDADPENPTAGEEVVLLKDYLGIAVAGVPVTSSNSSEITGDHIISGSVSFDSEEKILTLDNATIDYSETAGNPIVSSIDNLKVKLIGVNEIKIFSAVYFGFKYTDDATSGSLTFVDPTSFSEIGQLEITNQASEAPYISYSNLCSGYTITDFNNFMDGGTNDSDYTPENSGWVKSMVSNYFVKVRYIELYDLWIGGARITSANLTGNGYQNFDPETHSIAYSGSSEVGVESNLPELIIELDGECSIEISETTNTPAISFKSTEKLTSGKLKFIKKENSTNKVNSMTLVSPKGAITGFSSEDVEFETPLNLSLPMDVPDDTWDDNITKVVISDEVFYDLWVEGQQVTSRNKDDVKGENTDPDNPVTPSVVFDSETSTLNLTNANIIVTTSNENLNGGVVSGLENLTVKFKGSNSIKGSGVTTFYGFKKQGDKTCNITFTASESFDFMAETEPEYAVSGFSKVTYTDDLGAFTYDGCFYICEELSLGFDTTFDDNYNPIGVKIMSSGEIVSHKIVYAIDYAKDDLEDIPETEYTDVIPLATITAGPCIFTAYTLSLDGENTKSNNLKYYYFQYSDSEVIIGNGTTIDLKDYLLPTLTGEDEVDLYNSSEQSGSIININSENNTLTGIAYGTAVVTSSTEGVNTFTFGSGYELSIQVTVQDIIGKSTFASGQSYGTFYNTDQTYAYNVPEGLEAYIIKSVDEEKGEIVTEGTSVLPPSTPVLLYRTSTSGSANYVFTKVSGVEPANTELKYTATEKEAVETSKLYVLYNGQFVKVTSGTKILANHCYLDLANTSSGTRSYYDIDGSDGTTALREVRSEGVKGEKWNDGEWYTLQGRKFTTKPTKPGLYILNGKKVVIK